MSSSLLDRKIEYWEHRLLDLGKRNKMIHYRETLRSTLRLTEPSFEELYQRLAVKEETLTFQRPIDRESDIRVYSMLSLLEHLCSPLVVTVGDIGTSANHAERQKTLKHMRAKTRLAQEEQGTNILYLSFGFIEWRDGKSAGAPWIRSPLILVPAVLTVDALNAPYKLSRHEDDIVTNPTLQYYLRSEYGVELPSFDADKERLDDYLARVEALADTRGWRVIREVSLGLLSFLKITMYHDLIRHEARIRENAVIRAMSGDAEAIRSARKTASVTDPDKVSTRDCYQVMSADRSQQDAILCSKGGASFVMQGPPGTGKSQTITNIIAEALAEGKKILFVSEKMAALQVVYRRLQEAHLADFCLPLHSYKANKKVILEEIGRNLDLKQTRVSDTAMETLDDLMSVREELNRYAEELHRLCPELKMSCYEVYGKLAEVRDAPAVMFSMPSPLDVTPRELRQLLSVLRSYSQALQRIEGRVRGNPWEGLSSRTVSGEYTETAERELRAFTEALRELLDGLNGIKECRGLGKALSYEAIPGVLQAIGTLSALPHIPDGELDEETVTSVLSLAQSAVEAQKAQRALEEEITAVFRAGIYHFDHQAWLTRMQTNLKRLDAMPLCLCAEDPTALMKNASALHTALIRLREPVQTLAGAFSGVNQILGTHFTSTEENAERIRVILEALQGGERIPTEWADTNLAMLKAQATDVALTDAHVRAIRTRILSEWEEGVLRIDHAAMLRRYRTDYTSVMKVFYSQYWRDKKRLQALMKTANRDLSDESAIRLLNELDTYHAQKATLKEKAERVRDEIGVYFHGEETDWTEVLAALDAAERLYALPREILTEGLLDLVSRPHADAVIFLRRLLATIDGTIGSIRENGKIGDITVDPVAQGVDAAVLSPLLDEYITRLRALGEGFAEISPLLVGQDTTFETMAHAIGKLRERAAILDELDRKQSELKGDAGFLRAKGRLGWREILTTLSGLRDVRSLSEYPILRPLLYASDERKRELAALCEHLTERYYATRSPRAWLAAQFEKGVFDTDARVRRMLSRAEACLESVSMLGSWVDYLEARADCCEHGLGDFIERIEASSLYSDIERSFLRGFYYMWLGAACDRLDAVRRFRKDAHDDRIRRFAELDDLRLPIAQTRIRERLIRDLPSENENFLAADEVAILKKELGKKRNIMPLRKLFRMIPNLLLKLKPCLMMSPLSVSYFLETDAYHFDLVIFDEASQIFPEDAIGAICRGSQVIIAGDSKQLPPTDFFASATNGSDADYDRPDEEALDVVSDSILEEAASVLPNRTLLWHYRSRHESLIAFSNREIYGNRLITFPSSAPRKADMGVEYVYVSDGCYDRGGKKDNIREAERCTALIFEHIRQHPDRSLGIIAFSESQQSAIEDAVVAQRAKNPDCEWFFNESKEEPFFIKNLENVQGDERDTIIFSIGYGKDANGVMHMNFGPVGKPGGERRLNVAVTRAKCNIKLVGSILPSDIDTDRITSDGARMLRAYIAYAIGGTDALSATEEHDTGRSEDTFCKVIGAFLEEHGYRIRTGVGCSEYKIDIAVENPDGSYLAAIECDGASYIQAGTARDRDRLRRSVLQSMGWRLYRVWSTAWMRNPEVEGKALLAFLASLTAEADAMARALGTEENPPDVMTEIMIEPTPDVTSEIVIEPTPTVSDSLPYGFAHYEEADPTLAPHRDLKDDLDAIAENIRYILAAEAPIHMDVLYRRMAPTFAVGKITESVKRMVRRAVNERLANETQTDGEGFLYALPAHEITVRVPIQGESARPMEYISTEEVANALFAIAEQSVGITEEDLASACFRTFGFERRGPRIKRKTDAAMAHLLETGRIRILEHTVQCVGDHHT
ncbi:MAG: DUF4011 domain-containing protein [Clostridia bacterium]|nr:DUF4011 domain-containing protein [Clostridia bacterium]